MARQSKKENTENAMDQQDVETIVTENAPENPATGQETLESPATPENPQATEDANEGRNETPATCDENTPQEKEPEKPALESISVLANRHRVPSWQVAAMLRMMDWEADRLVADDEFAEALNMLQSRRIGGGRM